MARRTGSTPALSRNHFERIREQRIAIVNQIPTTREEALVAIGEVSSELIHTVAVGRRRHSCNDDSPRRQVDREERQISH